MSAVARSRETRGPGPRARGAAPCRSAARQRGLSLVELMIALVLGLIVVAAVFNVYAGTARSQRFTTGLMTMQESGRFGLSALQRGLRLAGFSERLDFDPFVWADGGRGADGRGERIVVRTEAPFDCAGVDTAATGGVAENAYEHDRALGAVTCAGNGGPPGVLVENVDEMRVLYGTDGNGDGVPERFVAHADVASPADVVALRVALLVNSGEGAVRSRNLSRSYAVLDTVTNPPFDDRVLREVFTTTVRLRNR